MEDGIYAARMLFPVCWFDATRVPALKRGLEIARKGEPVLIDTITQPTG